MTTIRRLCACGCGKPAPLVQVNDKGRNWVKGEPFKFIKGHHLKGINHPSWKGGRTSCEESYIRINNLKPGRGRSDYSYEHTLKAEKALGKKLPLGSEVHHANGTRNSGTLIICQDRAYHKLLHRRMGAYKACGHANWRKCRFCHQYDDPDNLYIHGRLCHHRHCNNEYQNKMRRGKTKC